MSNVDFKPDTKLFGGMRDIFLENFKGLIKKCKEFL
jgi:hypothetical protein